jgi:signal transduction histidine kinase
MRARALALGGEFKIHTAPGQGTRIEASVPVK